MNPEKKELLTGILSVIGGILIHFTFGHFYTIANMVPYIMAYTKAYVDPNVKDSLSIWLSALALGVQGISMPIGGLIAKKIGYRWVVGASCLFVSGSVLLTYVTIKRSFIGVMITYSLMKGAGLGLGYSVVLAVATAWFPARRGLIVGMIVGGFGLGALIFTPIQTAFINPKNVKVDNVTRRFTDPELLARVPNVFLMLGGILFTLQVIGFALLRAKPQPKALKTAGDMGTEEEKKRLPEEAVDNRVDASPSTHSLTDSPKGPWSAETPKRGRSDSIKSLRLSLNRARRRALSFIFLSAAVPDSLYSSEENLTPKQVLRRVDFYLLWFVMFCNIIPITIITSAYKLFGQAFISDDLFLSIVATISALFNSGGRIVWGSFVDRASFKIPLCVMLASWAAILVTFPHLNLATGVTLKVLYAIWVCLLFFSLSGVFAIMPAATGILFGPANLAVNYGLVFNAFAAGSLICGVIATVVQSKDAFLMQFTGCGAVCVAALFTVFWIEDRKMNPRLNICRWCSTRCPSLRAPTASGSVEMRSR